MASDLTFGSAECGPAASRPPRRSRFAGDRSRLARVVSRAPWVVAAAMGAATFFMLTGGRSAPGAAMIPAGSLSAAIDQLAPALGLGIDHVALTGHRFTPDGDIFDALDLAHARSLLAFDAAAARQRIARLPWVAEATIVRRVPNGLDVRVVERTAFAVWRRGAEEVLIDMSGRRLGAIRPGSVTGLPRVAGEGAASGAAELLGLLAAQAPDLVARLDTAERIGERRWTLHLSDGSQVHLPANTRAGLARLAAAGSQIARLGSGGHPVILDVRVPDRIAVRRATRAEGRGVGARAAPG